MQFLIKYIIRVAVGMLIARMFRAIGTAGMLVAAGWLATSWAMQGGGSSKLSQTSENVLNGKVVGIQDGDTLTVLVERDQVKVRLAEIDAPDKCQPFYEKSRQALASLCFGQSASLKVVDTDKYGRRVATVSCRGKSANHAQVAAGMAWVYTKYSRGTAGLKEAEQDARASRTGLWADKQPIPPWDWRSTGAHQRACPKGDRP